MGGELERTKLQKKNDISESGKTSNRNHKSKYQSIATDETSSIIKKRGSKSAMKTTNNNNNEIY